MSGTILPEALSTFVDANGKPLSGGSVYMYIPNTSTPKNTWQDVNLTILNTNPIILNASGQAAIWGAGQYRQVVYDQFNNLIWDAITEDTSGGLIGNMTDKRYVAGTDYTPGTTTTLTLPAGPSSSANLWVFFDSAFQADDQYTVSGTTLTFNSPIPVGVQEVNVKIGSTVAIGTVSPGTVTDASVAVGAGIQSSKLAFLQAGAGAVSRTVQSKLRESFSVTDFGAIGDGVTDNLAIITAAATALNAQGGGELYFPPGVYGVSASLVLSSFNNVAFVGAGIESTSILALSSGTFTDGLVTFSGCTFIECSGINFNINNKSVGTLVPALYFNSVTGGIVSDCELSHMSVIGIGAFGCTNIQIRRNKITLDVAFNSQNNGILVGSTTNLWIDSNNISHTGMLVAASNAWITNNTCENYKYGGGIGVGGNVSGASGPYYVVGNTCSGGTGIDTDGTYVAGMEFNGVGGICANNTCFNNSGVGIGSFSFGSVITGNVCYNNGTGGSPVHCAGILGAYQSSSQFFGDNVVASNTCYDSGSGTQLYGYQDAGDTRCTNNTFSANNFEHNVTSPFSMASTNSVLGAVYEGKVGYGGGSLPSGQSATFNVTCPGCVLGDFAIGSLDTLSANVTVGAAVNGANNVVITISNLSGSTVTLPAGNFRVKTFAHYM